MPLLKKIRNKVMTNKNPKKTKNPTFMISAFIFLFMTGGQIIAALITTFLIKNNYTIIKHSILPISITSYFVSMLIISIFAGILFTSIIMRFPMKPFTSVIDGINRLADGDFSMRLSCSSYAPASARQLIESLNKLAEELENNVLFRSDFINNFSHEFKTPIVSISGFAKLMKKNSLSEEERNEYLDIIIEESTRLTTLATNVLNLTKLEQHTIQTHNTDFNFAELVRHDILVLESKWSSKNLNLDIDLEEISFCGDGNLLSQLCINLLDNAIKFSPHNGDLSIKLRRADDEGHTLIFTVSDNGIGMNEQQIHRMYDKFYQADTSHSTEGNGLGLTVVKRIVEMYNGTIDVKSAPDNGCTFMITL